MPQHGLNKGSKQFKKKPSALCSALSDLAKKLNVKIIEPDYLRAFIAGRLIPLDKKPGVRPIAIGEVSRRIISKATVTLLKPDLIEATAPLQTCAGLSGGIEASIHAMRLIYEDPATEGVLLIDASNAFNALNREAALHNVQYTCPGLSTFVKNLYSGQAELFVASSGETILSKEGTTQGGPESMGFYAASTMPLANSADSHPCKRIFYADDGSGGADLIKLHEWWQDIQVSGPPLGYFPNAVKTWLIVKPEHRERADQLFQDINVTDGHEFLGSFIGNAEGAAAFVDDKIAEWEEDINALVEIAKIEPQLAYCAYVFGISRRWQFVCRTTPNIYEPMKKLERLIREKLIPAFIGCREVSDIRKVYALPARLGGLGIGNPVEDAAFEYENSMLITEQLTDAIFHQHSQLNIDEERQAGAKAEVSSRKSARFKAVQDELKALLSEDKMKLIDLSAEKGALIWLTSLPLKKYGFRINKQQFDDALCMRVVKEIPTFLQISNILCNCCQATSKFKKCALCGNWQVKCAQCKTAGML